MFDSFKINYKLIFEFIYDIWVTNFEEEIKDRMKTKNFWNDIEIINSIELSLKALNVLHNIGFKRIII